MKKKEIKLVVILSIVYFFCQISRSDLSAVFVDLIPDTGYTKEQVGLAITAGYISYAVGMLFNSLLVERTNPKWMIALALGGCFATHLTIRLCPLLPVMIAAWCVNGYLQSMIWPCVVRLFTADLRQEVRVRAMSIVSLAQHAGSVSCFLLVPLGLALGGWRVVISATAAALLTLFVAWSFIRTVTGTPEGQNAAPTPACKLSMTFFLRTNLLLILFLGVIVGMIRDGITTWAPVYYSESFAVSAVLATLLSALMPASKILAYVVRPAVAKAFPDTRKCLLACYICALVCAMGLLLAHLAGTVLPATLLMAALLLFNGCAGITYTIVLPVQYSITGRSVIISGLADCSFYVGAAIAAYLFAWISELGGWVSVITTWGCCCAAALLVILLKKDLIPTERALKEIVEELGEN